MNRNRCHLCIIMDRSGSMQSIAKDMEGGLNSFIEDQKKLPGELTVSYYRFDDYCEKVLHFEPVQSIGELRLEPRGMTALNDAIGMAIKETGQTLARIREEDRPGLVTVLIITDGGENSSKEYTSETIKTMVTEQESKYNWKFNYLGANQDSFAVASNYGINVASVSNYSTSKSDKVWKNYSGKVLRSRNVCATGGLPTMDFCDEERDELN